MERRRPNLRLQEARALKGWSQEELAARLGTTFETVSRWERGLMLPSPYFRTRLYAVFGMTAEALGLLFETDMALHSSLSSTQVVVAWAALDKEHEVVGHVLAALQAQCILTVSPWLLGRRGPAQKQQSLDEAIRAAQLVLLILSPHAPASRDVRTTLHLAQLYGRPLAALWIAGDQQQECLPPNAPSLLSLIDARTGDKETIVQGVLDLVEQTTPAEHTKMEEPPPAETSSAEEGFQQTSLEVLERPVEEDTLQVEARPLSMLERRNRQRLLDKVQMFWITGVLDHSLHGMARIALRLSALPDAVEHPWRLVFAQPDRPPLLFEAGTTMSQVYDRACGELLILGEPGAGKTTLLLELARDLIARARSDETLHVPVVFNLSSWSQEQLPLAEWLVEELHLKYQVPRQLATAWVQTDTLLPLLDGVDEVPAEHREACIKAINAFRWEHGLLPMVVCSRSIDYFMQPQRIVLHSAVMVQPLTPVQIEAYVEQAGEPLSALRVALHRDAALYELTSTPLMLSILTLTYHGVPVEELLRGASLTDRQQQIFKHYVERMLRHRGTEMRYTQEQTTHWLTFLAQQMKQHNQTVFYLEHLQPNWLSGDRIRQAYDRWALRFPAILMGMLVGLAIVSVLFSPTLPYFSLPFLLTVLGGFIGWLLSAGSTTQQPHESSGRVKRSAWSPLLERPGVGVFIGLSTGLSLGLDGGLSLGLDGGLLNGLFFGLLSGLFFGLGSILLQTVLEKSNRAVSSFQAPPLPWKPRWQHLIKHVGIRNGILVGLLFGLSVGLSTGLSAPMSIGGSYGLGIGLSIGLSTGLSGGLLSVLLIGKPVDIFLADELVWSWKSLGRSLLAKRHLRTTLGVTILIGLLSGLSIGLSGGLLDGLFFGLRYGLSYGLSFWLLLGLFQGVSSETIGDQHRIIPNQGIRHSARNGLVFGLISVGIVGLLNWLNIGLDIGLNIGLGNVLTFGLSIGLIPGLIAGLSVGLLAGLLNGGLACLRHSVVRLLLWRSRAIPLNYPRFLDYAAERILLRKLGGGYIFVHRLLLEYFASLEGAPTLDVARAKKEQESPAS